MKIKNLKRLLLVIFLITLTFLIMLVNIGCSSSSNLADAKSNADKGTTTIKETTTTKNNPPIAEIKTDKYTRNNINTEINFSASNSSDPDGDALSYEWILWDGTKKNVESFSLIFNEIGDFEIKLIVSDGKESAEDSIIISIIDQAPVIVLDKENISCNFGDVLTLSAKGTSDSEGSEVKISWILPDGTILEGEEIEYTVTEVGESEITVLATDGTNESKEKIKITAKESEEQFKASCENVKYSDLLRNPDDYKFKRIHVKGKIVQRISDMEFHFNITKGSYGFWDDRTWLVLNNKPEENIIEDDIVEVWGFGGGNYDYETALGSINTIPVIFAEYVDIIQKAE